jgi:hypothetical protein
VSIASDALTAPSICTGAPLSASGLGQANPSKAAPSVHYRSEGGIRVRLSLTLGHDVDVMMVASEAGGNGPVVTPRARLAVERALNNRFEPGSKQAAWPGVWQGGVKTTVQRDDLPVPPMVRWILHDFLGGPDTGRDEKLSWQVLFKFEGRKCAMAFQKFGLRLYFDATDLDEPSAVAFAKAAIGRLKKAVRVAEREVFRDFAEQQVRAGNVTITNQFHDLRSMYEHFRYEAENPPEPAEEDLGEGIFAPHWNRMAAIERLRFYNAVAMVNAYFSLLEHVLVIVWPFVNYQPGVDDLEDFVGKRWSDKFRTVFDVSVPGKPKTYLDRLLSVAEEYRNTYAHGGFDKHRGAFLSHFDGGAMPAVLNDIREHRRFDLFPIQEPSLSTIVGLLDEVDEWLLCGPAAFGMRYAAAGYDVPLNPEHLDAARRAMCSDEGFDEWLAHLGYQIDMMMNMDW